MHKSNSQSNNQFIPKIDSDAKRKLSIQKMKVEVKDKLGQNLEI